MDFPMSAFVSIDFFDRHYDKYLYSRIGLYRVKRKRIRYKD